MSKAPRTVRRYAAANRTQQNLDRWLGVTSKDLASITHHPDQTNITTISEEDDLAQLDHTFDDIPASILVALDSTPCGDIAVDSYLTKQSDRQDTSLGYQDDYVPDCEDNIETLSSDGMVAGIGMSTAVEELGRDLSDPDDQEAMLEDDWEEELAEEAHGGQHIRGWLELRKQIKTDLKTKHKSLTLTQHNQLLILCNFATLHLKGVKRIAASLEIAHQWHDGQGEYFARRVCDLARHYQLFEQLPVERRGGSRNARTLLLDGTIRKAARTWLYEQKPGTVTPRYFQAALNNIILPALGITMQQPLCECTAR
jgi:hypothetical protein